MGCSTLFHYFGGLSSLLLSLQLIHSISATHVYIVYLGHTQNRDPLLTSEHHLQILANVFKSKGEARQAMLYSYKHGFSGFSAKLNSSQANSIAKMKGVISVFKSKILQLHTTRSWDFIGLTLDGSEGMPLQLAYGDSIIVGIFDTGIWPESDSFQEQPGGIDPVPKNWKGKCVAGEQFNPAIACNRKLIGARYYLEGFEQQYGQLNQSGDRPDYRSARDYLGHGTHTASTAVGSVVKNASLFGFGQGVARGGAPRSRLAVYKVCWNKDFDGKCAEADIMAAFDDALHDGVDVISASFGAKPPLAPFFASGADIGSFHAMQMGVSVVFSAGNSGPDPSLVGNVAPWSLCVAASSIDRTFPTQILLDGNVSFVGESLVAKEINARLAGASTYFFGGVCKMENLKNRTALGRVILCFSTVGSVMSEEAEVAAKKANASGLIFVEPLGSPVAAVSIIPIVRVDITQGTKIGYYLAQSLKLPRVKVSPSRTVLRKLPAPTVADFSSRGPSSISPDILKPDISGPGINILAAWPPKTPPSVFPAADIRSVNWNFQSGTSMSCPHVSGIVALLKSAHPNWSPAAIRSALMTTAYNMDTTYDKIRTGGSLKVSDPFDVGAGHVNPLKAMDPGLIYDMSTSDYISFLCNNGYTEDQVKSMLINPSAAPTSTSCKLVKTNANINYPSITVSNLKHTITIQRTVRNMGHRKTAIYFVSTLNPHGVKLVIWPQVLIFSPSRQVATYYVTLMPQKISQWRYEFGEIAWSDGFHYVTSPVVVLVNTTEAGAPGGFAVNAT